MSDRMKFWVIAGAMVALSVMTACGGLLDSGNWVRASVPIEIQKSEGLPKSLTLNQSQSQFEAWQDDTARVGLEWTTSIQQAREVQAIVDAFTLEAIAQYGPQLGGVPVLGAVVPLLVGGLGLAARRPGDVSRSELQKEKESSHEHGRKVGAGEVV